MKPYGATYMFYNAENEVIYIGMSQQPYKRELEHKKTSFWYPEVAKMTVKWWQTRARALQDEKYKIRRFKPKYNTLHNKIGQS